MKRDAFTSTLLILAIIGLMGIINLTLGGKKLPAGREETGEEEHHHSMLMPRAEKEEEVITPASLGVLSVLTPTSVWGNVNGKVVMDAFLRSSDKKHQEVLEWLKAIVQKNPQALGLRFYDLDTPEGRMEMARAAVNAPGVLINGEPPMYHSVEHYTLSAIQKKVAEELAR